jgi:hypothetical protein
MLTSAHQGQLNVLDIKPQASSQMAVFKGFVPSPWHVSAPFELARWFLRPVAEIGIKNSGSSIKLCGGRRSTLEPFLFNKLSS